MLGLVLSVAVIGWIIAVYLEFSKREGPQLRITAATLVRGVAGASVALAVIFGIKAYGDKEFFGANLATSFGSIAITVFVLDTLNERRRLEERKQEIFEEMESPVRDVAVEAVRLARKYGWLDEALQKVDLKSTKLAGVDFSNAQLVEAEFAFADLQEANLNGANLQRANLNRANLQEANLNRANLQGAFFENANLQEANLSGANLKGADLYRANLQGANLNGANLQGAFLNGANLKGTFLTRADLRGATYSAARLQEAKYNHSTVWPENFDPQAAGTKLVP